MVCSGGPLLLRAWMLQLAALKRRFGVEVIWVTSGAIASGVDRATILGSSVRMKSRAKRTLAEKQALSAIGQPMVMDLYNMALHATGLLGGQVLLTYEDFARAKQRANLVNTLEQLLKWGVTPILNENDTTATEEIRFGDNDSLSAKVASAMKADRLIILTDVAGLYDADPKKNPNAKLIHELKGVGAAELKLAGGTSSLRGTGGMRSKLLAAQEAHRARVETWLVPGDALDVLIKVAENKKIGTRITRQK